jgi:hypothetical protein
MGVTCTYTSGFRGSRPCGSGLPVSTFARPKPELFRKDPSPALSIAGLSVAAALGTFATTHPRSIPSSVDLAVARRIDIQEVS